MTAGKRLLDELEKKVIRDKLEDWAYYKQQLYIKRHGGSTSLGNMYAESVSAKEGRGRKSYPYQDHIYQCQTCEKQFLKRPDEGWCPNCNEHTVIRINEGVSGQRVFASMIHGQGKRVNEWAAEQETDDAVRACPRHLRKILIMNYLYSGNQQEKSQKMGLSRAQYQSFLYQAEMVIYGWMKAKGLIF